MHASLAASTDQLNRQAVFSMQPQLTQLSDVVRLGPGAKRDAVTMALARFIAARPLADGDAADALGDALRNLVMAASRDLRARVAAKIAEAAWAPRDLVMALALDDIDIAAPVIGASEALLEDDLIDIARLGARSHREALARRPGLAPAVCDALVALCETEVLAAVLENASARLSDAAFHVCLDAAKSESALHAPLVRRNDLPLQIVEAAYLMLGEALRAEIAARYDIDEDALRRILSASVSEAAVAEADEAQRDQEASALMRSLLESGALTGDYLVRALQESRIDLFEHAVAQIIHVDIDRFRAILLARGVWAAALACRVCGLRRRAFTTAHRALAMAGRVPGGATADIERAAANVYMSETPDSAAEALRRLAAPA